MDSSAARQPATGISAGPGRSGERGKATLPWARVPRRRRLLSGGLVAACIAIASLVGPNDVAGHELCANNVEFPAQHAGLAFCPEYRYGCCSAAQDGLVKQQFEQWVGTLPANNSCAALFRGMACSHCDAWGAHLLGTEEAAAAGRDISIPPVPFICKDFCGQVFDACGRTVLQSNPFLGNRSGSLSEAYATKEAFCTASSIEGQYCYSGKVFEAPTNVSAPIVDSTNATLNHHPLCLTRVGHQRYLSIAEFPGKNTLITHTQSGKFYLYDMAKWSGVGAFPQPKLLMDLSGEIIYSGELGMFSMAFHPSFASNGLFYLSYTCDTVTNAATCPPAAECGCKAPQCTSDAEDICRYVSTVAEYYYNATSDTAPVEKRKIFRLGQPFSNHNGGQLLMSPTGEPHLFLTLGDGGNAGDPYNFAQSSTSLLGKILKFDLSRTDPTWALQYGTFGEMGEGWRGEIFAAGLRNPWRCDWLPDEAESLMCADVGQNA